MASLKHGLTASTLVVLPEEHEHEYQKVLQRTRLLGKQKETAVACGAGPWPAAPSEGAVALLTFAAAAEPSPVRKWDWVRFAKQPSNP